MSGRAQGNSACAKFALGRVAPPDRPLSWPGVQGGAWSRVGAAWGSRGSHAAWSPKPSSGSRARNSAACLLNGLLRAGLKSIVEIEGDSGWKFLANYNGLSVHEGGR